MWHTDFAPDTPGSLAQSCHRSSTVIRKQIRRLVSSSLGGKARLRREIPLWSVEIPRFQSVFSCTRVNLAGRRNNVRDKGDMELSSEEVVPESFSETGSHIGGGGRVEDAHGTRSKRLFRQGQGASGEEVYAGTHSVKRIGIKLKLRNDANCGLQIISIIEDAARREPTTTAFEILQDEWGTMSTEGGTRMPTLGVLLELLIDINAIRAASYLAKEVMGGNRSHNQV
jgi:hypothetical protein